MPADMVDVACVMLIGLLTNSSYRRDIAAVGIVLIGSQAYATIYHRGNAWAAPATPCPRPCHPICPQSKCWAVKMPSQTHFLCNKLRPTLRPYDAVKYVCYYYCLLITLGPKLILLQTKHPIQQTFSVLYVDRHNYQSINQSITFNEHVTTYTHSIYMRTYD